ncbi:MAG: Rne/Rng family ribonuclease, partial [Geminicoccaceae bacterium]
NIYLAKVTRVEPSLQAAFVDYGGDRHGFLAFSEIHPDYYQIPQADRHLLEEANKVEPEQETGDGEATGEPDEGEPPENGASENGAAENGAAENGADESEDVSTDPDEETEEVYAEQAKRRQRLLRNYKIQEVIKRRQIVLVQVVKEERGNKGAALTTYLSLAGRYCVLMPNTARGGGISRKIANVKDRARLKTIARDLDVPEGMGLIVRTAGQSRNKLEIRRDYDYLLRLWSDIRDRTLDSIAPCTIHEEGALVKRAIRDIYDSDIGEILVEGEEGYKSAKKVMTMLMPSRARRIKQYKEELPLFHHFQIEPQLDALHSPTVELKSGGSIVINPTEALTAIDVNSGRATRERNIEETALRTNSEAAEEIARQLRLRDLAGLVVIDFIDMIELRNQRIVERRLRDALRFDRARIQLGRISAFGLLELSRQRLRPSFLELSTQPCPICAGSGTIRSVESAALQALRALEIEGMKGNRTSLSATLPMPVALYLLNQKRDLVVSLEQRYSLSVKVEVDTSLIAGNLRIETAEADGAGASTEEEAVPSPARTKGQSRQPSRRGRGSARSKDPEEVVETDDVKAVEVAAGDEDGEGQRRKRRRRRRRRRSGGDAEATTAPTDAAANEQDLGDQSAETPADQSPADEDQSHTAEPADTGSSDQTDVKQAEEAGDEDAARPGRRRRRSSTRGRRRGQPQRGGSGRSQSGTNGAEQQPSVPAFPETVTAEPSPMATAASIASSEAPSVASPAASSTSHDEPMPASATIGATASASTGEESYDMPAPSSGDDVAVAPPTPAPAPPPPQNETQPTPAVIAESERTEPRRGWWNRFVRKQD